MSRSDETVAVMIPRQVWGQMASIADNQGVTVADLLVAGVNAAIKKMPIVRGERSSTRRLTAAQRDQLRRLIIAGRATEFEMAAAVGCHPNTVTNWKRKLRMSGEWDV